MYNFIKNSLFALALTSVSTAHATWKTEGERLTYDVGYSFISAGLAEITYQPLAEENRYNVIGRAWTHDGLSGLFRIDDRINAYGLLKGAEGESHSTKKFETRVFENDYSAHKLMEVDRLNNQAIYKNVKDESPAKIRKIQPLSRDLFSALYHLRQSVETINVGDVFTLPIADLTKNYTLTLSVLKRERIGTKMGTKQTLKVRPVLSGLSQKRKKDKLYIWITDDAERTPVKFEIDLLLGSFTANIVHKGAYDSKSHAPTTLPEQGPTSPRKRNTQHVNLFEDEK